MMSPGTYLRTARERLNWSLEDLAEHLRTDPHVPARRLIDWLAAIEADRERIDAHAAFALADVLKLDLLTISRLQEHADAVLAHLVDLPAGVLTMSTEALLRHTGQPQTAGGLIRAGAIARAAGWVFELPGNWRRPVLIAVPRT
ncbi:helix-turn-helix transcriptional regulator [uncultured Sphingomonas sp.]|uniref:helix-turn-helix domain-containing protein n=1 Tax=uncultured Sphingomonas sp. TaxID=158754 RepID=UPI00258D50C7|nr:helix-turn-helix transcriptional regulator [uncultured Sphingomonas sp.]